MGNLSSVFTGAWVICHSRRAMRQSRKHSIAARAISYRKLTSPRLFRLPTDPPSWPASIAC